MTQVNIRLMDNAALVMLLQINPKEGKSSRIVIELFTYLRQATLIEIKGRFTPQEITAIAQIYRGIKPAWQVMCNSATIISNVSNAEKLSSTVSSYEAKLESLVQKLGKLTAAQAAILQLELISFWSKGPNPDLEPLIKSLS
jgi:nitrate/nitrite-specific signal transduction histidine kinase